LHTLNSLQTLAQHWECLLFTTGGALNLRKRFWHSIHWIWRNGKAQLVTSSQAPGIIKLTSGDNQNLEELPRIEATKAFRTLGVYLTPSGSQKVQMEILRGYAQKYHDALQFSTLTSSEAFLSYTQCPKLMYPLSCTSLTPAQCWTIQATVLAALLPKLHLNRHSPPCSSIC
jgi:hypothetical protein